MTVIIRPALAADYDQWLPLWHGYLKFYRTRPNEAVTAETWHRILDPKRAMHALVAELDGALVGIAHYLFHDHFWMPEQACYLSDLYVSDTARGLSAGKKLIEAVYAAADAAGAGRTYWLTQEYNAEARSLYDTLAKRTSYIRYQR
jgi:GNAT superfamily N-acetyltransferase